MYQKKILLIYGVLIAIGITYTVLDIYDRIWYTVYVQSLYRVAVSRMRDIKDGACLAQV